MLISKRDREVLEVICSELIKHLQNDFALTKEECLQVIMKYNSKDRKEDFAHYLYRTVLIEKGFELV